MPKKVGLPLPAPSRLPPPSSQGYAPLCSGAPSSSSLPKLADSTVVEMSGYARVGITQPLARVRLAVRGLGQFVLSWDEPLQRSGVTVAPGQLNLYSYPGHPWSSLQLALLRDVMICLASKAPEFFEATDPVGAAALHALLVCNTDESLALAFSILDVQPRLLLQTHVGEPFNGETCLHILSANRREYYACLIIDIALARCSTDEVRAFLNTQALGVFFDAEPMRWYGESPLAYACVFGLRQLVRKMVETRLVRLDDTVGGITGFYPLHAAAANGLSEMCKLIATDYH